MAQFRVRALSGRRISKRSRLRLPSDYRDRLLCITAPDDFSRRAETEGQSLAEMVAMSFPRALLRHNSRLERTRLSWACGATNTPLERQSRYAAFVARGRLVS